MPCVSLVTTAPSDGIAWINDNGTPSDPTDDVLRYRPEPNYHGADSFTYTLTDLAGASVTRTITLTISATNDAPVIPNLDLVTYADEALTFDLLEFAEDADGDTLTVASWTEPENGELAYDTETKVFTYTPDEEFLGDDSFEATINDGAGGVVVVQIKFTVRIPLHFATAVHDASSEFDSLVGPALAMLDRPDGAAWAPTLGTYREYITLMFEATEAIPVGLIVYGDLGNAYVSRIEVNSEVVTCAGPNSSRNLHPPLRCEFGNNTPRNAIRAREGTALTLRETDHQRRRTLLRADFQCDQNEVKDRPCRSSNADKCRDAC